MKRLDIDLKQNRIEMIHKNRVLCPYLLDRIRRLIVFPTSPSKERIDESKPDIHHLKDIRVNASFDG